MSSAQAPSVLLIGAGRMGGALLKGWLAQGHPPDRLFVKEPHPHAQVAALIETHGLSAVPDKALDVMVFAVKPQALNEAIEETAAVAGPHTTVLSVAAGRTTASIAKFFTPETAIVRAMPNLPAEIGQGISALFATPAATVAQKATVEGLMRSVGEAVWLKDEEVMDAVTAVSGSGPAYVFALVEALAQAGQAAGLPAPLADRLARATVTGAGALLSHSSLSPQVLRENVTSPNGTTAAGLGVLLKAGGLNELLTSTVAAAQARSKELSQ